MAIILSICNGITVVLGRVFNAQLGARAGVKYSTLMNYLVGLIGTLAIILFYGNIWEVPFPQKDMPFVYYLGGMLGVGGVAFGAWATSRAPSMQMTLIIFITQLFTGLMLDAFLLDKFSPGQLVGGVIVLVGVVLNVLADKPHKEVKQ